jgi:hypothetical protein
MPIFRCMVVEDEFESTSTTFHPPSVCQPPPYCGGVEDPQDDIILDDYVPDRSCDSAMEDAEPECWEVVGSAATTQTVQSLPLVVSRNECVSFSGVLPWPSIETAVFVNTGRVLTFKPPVVAVANSVVPRRLLLPQTAHLQASAPSYIPDQPQPSTSMAETKPLNHQGVVIPNISTSSVLAIPVGPTATCSSRSPSSPPPPKVVSNPASPSTYTTIVQYKRALEGLEEEIDSCPASPAGIPRKMSALMYVLVDEYL